MFTLNFNRPKQNCDGVARRDFLKIGALGAGSLGLGTLLRQRALAATQGSATHNKSVIWIWLAGGPTHVETFDPNLDAPAEYRSVTGECKTPVAGVTVGGTLPRIASVVDRMALVRSFAHRNSGHGGGTHWVMTGYDNKQADNGGVPNRPSLGSIVSRYRGANHPRTGMPSYIRLSNIQADGPTFLGTSYAPFDSGGQARKNLSLSLDAGRFDDRQSLLGKIDQLNRRVDASGLMEGLDSFEQQAAQVVLGSSHQAFDLKHEDPKLVARYGKGLGQQLLTARRLCEAGAGFVTLSTGGWDMHGKIATAMGQRSPQLDQGVATLIEDLDERGMLDDTLVVITGEFGRTPKVNKNAGRDHWAPLSTLALAGGGLKMGQTVGESAPKGDVPATTPIRPLDLMATIFHVMGLPQDLQYYNEAGRPVSMNTEGRPIAELI